VKDLATILKKNDIDTSTLRLLFELDSDRVFAVTADGEGAVDLWEKLCGLVDQTGRWPVILGRDSKEDLPTERRVCDAVSKAEYLETYPTTDTILAGMEVVDEVWFAAQQRRRVADLEADMNSLREKGYNEDADCYQELLAGPDELRGIRREEWPDEVDPYSPWAVGASITHDRNGTLYEVTIGLFPYPEGWKVPAVMKFGGWNACPPPQEHCSVMRFWQEKYGARLACMTHDTVEFMVSKPPTTKEAALLLARDHYLYCEDSVEQGTHSLDRLAAGLLEGEAWYFWWD
jgi:hypothetical protein